MVVKSLALLLSLCCVAMLPELPSVAVMLFLTSLCIVLVLPVHRLRMFEFAGHRFARYQLASHRLDVHRLTGAKTPLAIFIAGFVYGCFNASFVMSRHLPSELLGVEVEVVATIVDLPHRDARRLRFVSELESIRLLSNDTSLKRRGRVRLNWYGDSAPDLKAGDKVKLVVKLKEPSGFLNPGGFDLERWLIQNKIVATGYVRDKSFDITKSVIANSLAPLSTARNRLQRKLLSASDGLASQGVILALAVGDRSGVGSEQWDRFISTGTNHLLAISGLHISLVAGFFALLVQTLWRLGGLPVSTTRKGCSLAVALGAAFCYAAMAGFSIPTVRALMMFSVLVCLLVLRRHQRRTQSLAIALIVVCLADPLSVLAPGFWMSFAAVAVLFLVFSNSQNKSKVSAFARLMRGHLLVSIGLYPLTLLFFGQASLIAPVANLFVTPLVGMLVTPLVFLSAMVVLVSTSVAGAILIAVDFLLQLTFYLLGIFSSLPFALVKLSGVSSVAVALCAGAAFLMIVPVSVSLRAIAVVLIAPLLFPGSGKMPQGAYRVTFLDVGQGTSVVVRTSNHTLIYDTGDQFSRNFSAAEAVLIPYLRSKGVSVIDALVVSHADRDHSGGADEVLDEFKVERLILSSPLPQRPEASHVICKMGDSWEWDNVSFTILHPRAKQVGSENDRSCVLRISTAGGVHTLLPGDIETYGEGMLLRSGALQQVEILLSPHHGSATSSGVQFVNVLQPAFVIHSTGFKNRFKFPKSDVTDRYHAANAKQLNTAHSGAIEFHVEDTGIRVSEYRKTNKRWWHRK